MIAKLQARLSGFAGKSISSLLVKVSGALAGYLFFMVFAKRLGPEQFGLFAFALTAANFGMLAAGFGQPLLILRDLTYALTDKDMKTGRAVLQFGLRATLLGAVFGVLGMGLFGLLAPMFGAPAQFGLYLAAAGLLVALVAAELFGSLQRVVGRVVFSIAPKDLIWRVLSIAVLAGLAWLGVHLNAVEALWLTCALLAVLVLGQAVDALRRMPKGLYQGTAGAVDLDKMRKASLHFWGIAVASGLAQHLTVVAIGFRSDPATIGAFFAAFRTATLLSMPLTAASIVLGPLIARHHKEGRRDLIQKAIVEFIILATAPTLFGLAILVIWGRGILGLFDPSYAVAYPALIVFALSFLINTLSGPCAYVMMMSGAERKYLQYSIATNLVSVVGAGIAAGFGLIWAAVVITLANATLNLLAARWSRRHAGIEATIACLWRPRSSGLGRD